LGADLTGDDMENILPGSSRITKLFNYDAGDDVVCMAERSEYG